MQDQVGHHLGGCGREQDAVAVVAGGDEVMRPGGMRAEQREAVGGCGTKAGPGVHDAGAGERGHERGGLRVQCGDVRGMDGLVEADVLDRGADDGAAGLWALEPWNDVEVPACGR